MQCNIHVHISTITRFKIVLKGAFMAWTGSSVYFCTCDVFIIFNMATIYCTKCMHCDNFDSKSCWQIELKDYRFTWWVAYQNIVTRLEFYQHKSKSISYCEVKYLVIKCCRNGINLNWGTMHALKNRVLSRIIKAGCVSMAHSKIRTNILILSFL